MQVHRLGHPRGTKQGTCGLCGFEGKLSKTHVPPRAVGNVGEARPAVLYFDEATGESTIALGNSAGQGGMWGWWLCARCNNRTAKWEGEYRRWSAEISRVIREHPAPAWKRLSARNRADPGAFVRVLWSWMFAIDEKLRWGWPELAESILTGEPATAPRGLRLLLTATTSPWIAAMKPVRAQWTGTGWDPDAANQPRVAVSAPPFVAYLAVEGTDPAPGSLDTTDWLADRAGERRPLDLELLIVETLTDEDVERMRAFAPSR